VERWSVEMNLNVALRLQDHKARESIVVRAPRDMLVAEKIKFARMENVYARRIVLKFAAASVVVRKTTAMASFVALALNVAKLVKIV